MEMEHKTFWRELSTLFEKNYGIMYRAVCSITDNPQDAEDIVQSVFQKLMEREPGAEFVQNAAGYLYRSAINEALKMRTRRRPEIAEEAVESLEIPAPAVDAYREEQMARMDAARAFMKPEHAEILRLRYKEDLRRSQIARKLKRSTAAVAMELVRARAELKRLMQIQEEQGETQKHQGDDRPVLADAAKARGGSRRRSDLEPAGGGAR